MKFLSVLFPVVMLCAFLVANGQADISFTNADWTFNGNATLNTEQDQLTIINDGSGFYFARITVDIPPNTSELYMSADIFLENIVVGDRVFKAPKMKLLNASDNSVIQACNYESPAQGAWYNTFCGTGNLSAGITSVIVEFSIQNASGTYLVQNPQLHFSEPQPTPYSFPYDVPSNTSCTLSINSAAKQAFNNDLLSTNSHFTFTPVTGEKSWSSPEVVQSLNNFYPMENLRFPGGTVGNFYDWQTDGFFGDQATFDSPFRQNLYNQSYRFDYEGFKDFINADNSRSATLMFNVIQDDVSTSVNRLQDRLNDNLNIKYIELGNETYFDKQSFGYASNQVWKTSDVNAYINFSSTLAAQLKAIDPTIDIAVPIDHQNNYEPGTWSAALAVESYYDYGVVHSYINTQQGDVFDLITGVTLLNTYKTKRKTISDYKSNFPNTPMIMTEWGVLGSKSFMSAIAVADGFLAILEGDVNDDVVKQAGIHMFYHTNFNDPKTLMYLDNGSIVHTPVGVLYSKLINTFMDTEVYEGLGKGEEIDTDLPGVISRAFLKNDSVYVLAVNKMPQASEIVVNLDGENVERDYEISTYSMSPELWPDAIANPDAAWAVSNNSGAMEVPAYSINIIKFSKDLVTSSETLQLEEVTLYPNPSEKLVFLKGVAVGSHYQIHDLGGKMLQSGNYTSNGISIENLSQGVYYLSVGSSKMALVVK